VKPPVAAAIRLKTRAQFQAALAGPTVSRTAHFALHRLPLAAPAKAAEAAQAAKADAAASAGPADVADAAAPAGPGSERPQALFAVHAPWVGAVVPKRWAKRAVTRNTIKRQIHAVAQEFASSLPPAAHVVRLRSAFDRVVFPSATSPALRQAVRGELLRLFGKGDR
jgi:ribonuclease P protein component